MTFDEMMQTIAPHVSTDWVNYEDDPMAYLVAGAIAADSEKQTRARDWYVRRIEQRAAELTR